MKRIKLLFDSLELEKIGTKRKYYLKGQIFYECSPLTFERHVSVVVCTARKLTLDILEHDIDMIKSFPFLNDIVVVVGSESDKNKLKDAFQDVFLKVVVNNDASNTVYTSIKIGMRAVSTRSSLIVLLFGGETCLKKEVLKALLERAIHSDKVIFVPKFGEKRGHPLVFSKRAFPDLLSLRKEKGIPYLLRKFSNEIEEVPIEN